MTASINVTISGVPGQSVLVSQTAVGPITISGGIGPAATYNGTNTIGVSQLSGGVGVTVSTSSGVFLISSYDTATIRGLAPVQTVAGRTGAISLAAADVSGLHAVATSGSFTSLTNVPVAFTPITHTHDISEVAGLATTLTTFAPLDHTHGTAAITGITASFAPLEHTHGTAAISGITASFAALAHTHGTTDVQGLTASFAPLSHTHGTAAISGLTAAITANSVQSVNGKTGQTISLAPVDITAVTSSITGISGASAATNMVVISQASFDAIATPSTATIYFIV